MAMTAKVENYCLQQKSGAKSIYVDGGERVCVNCIWYQQYFRENRGNVKMMYPTSGGCCILLNRQRGPLCQPCKDFEIPEGGKAERDSV